MNDILGCIGLIFIVIGVVIVSEFPIIAIIIWIIIGMFKALSGTKKDII